jgi:Holliday junction resolvase
MSAANKAKGSRFEALIEEFLNSIGIKARRLPRAGSNDIGDVAVEFGNGHVVVIEAKNTKTTQMAQYLREADVEAVNYDKKYNTVTYPVVVTKTRQKGVGDARVTMTMDTFTNLLKWEGLA